jgi:hypothetical protein
MRKGAAKRRKPIRRPSATDRYFKRQQRMGDQDAIAFAQSVLWFANKSRRNVAVQFSNPNGDYEARTQRADTGDGSVTVLQIPPPATPRRVS